MTNTPMSGKQAIRMYCAAHNLTQSQLAVQVGIHLTTFSQAINGLRRLTDEQYAAVLEKTGIDLREFAAAS